MNHIHCLVVKGRASLDASSRRGCDGCGCGQFTDRAFRHHPQWVPWVPCWLAGGGAAHSSACTCCFDSGSPGSSAAVPQALGRCPAKEDHEGATLMTPSPLADCRTGWQRAHPEGGRHKRWQALTRGEYGVEECIRGTPGGTDAWEGGWGGCGCGASGCGRRGGRGGRRTSQPALRTSESTAACRVHFSSSATSGRYCIQMVFKVLGAC